MTSLDKRGNGFVHLNTPASISYTPGQALTLTELTRKRERVECVTLPASIAIWRRAFHTYTSSEGFQAMAADVEDERAYEGVILPPLAKRSTDTITYSFFSVPSTTGKSGILTRTCEGQLVACSSSPSLDQGSLKTESDRQGCPMSLRLASQHEGFSTSHETNRIAEPPGGIHIVSHHKIIGKSEFTYLDHDGILSSGVVPEVVITPEEKARKEVDKIYYISPSQMTNSEFNAFEELQSLWKSKARSHSVQGAMHRAAEEGSEVAPATISNDDGINSKKNPHSGIQNYGRVPSSCYQSTSALSAYAGWCSTEVQGSSPDDVATEEILVDALRMVDDLLRFSNE
ncbi:unnamed protein product [Phytomonas sp. EM1]|nr:unnamed protein product [Phytomonas sp. EM1]|eukprot:CCW60803.1 unnamed protein product [Phytomonas sp. isolate EM1]